MPLRGSYFLYAPRAPTFRGRRPLLAPALRRFPRAFRPPPDPSLSLHRSGIIALPRAIARLGWIAGPILLVVFLFITILTMWLLVDVYEVNGVENGRYHLAVRNVLGNRYAVACLLMQLLATTLTNIAYTIGGASGLHRVAQLACEINGTASDDCWDTTWKLTLVFAASLVPAVQIPNLEDAWWSSALGVFMTLNYSVIAMALSIKNASHHDGTIGGTSTTPAKKAFQVLGSLGSLAFAYAAHAVALEISDTVRQPPKTSKVMRKAISVSLFGIFALYSTVGFAGYSAEGNDVHGFLFDGFSDAPRWVVLWASLTVSLHMIFAIVLYAQPLLNTVETLIVTKVLKQGREPEASAQLGAEAGEQRALDSAEAAKAADSVDDDLDTLKSLNAGDFPVISPTAGASASQTAAIEYAADVVGATDAADGRDVPFAFAAAGAGAAARPPPALEPRPSLGMRLVRLSRRLNENAAMPSTIKDGYLDTPHLQGKTSTVAKVAIFWPIRFVVRTLYVVVLAVIACCLPFFGDFTSLVGALTFYPFAIFFPIVMWRRVYRPTGWVNVLLFAIMVVMLLVDIAAIVGSIDTIVVSSKSYSVF